MKIGLAQINTTVGDFRGNAERIKDAYRSLVQAGARLVVFPEMAVTGYPPRDLLFKSGFVPDAAAAMKGIARETGEVPALVGYVTPNPQTNGRLFFNSAAWCQNGAVGHVFNKCLLPAYDVFDEERYFQPATAPGVVKWEGLKIGVTLCEDIWNHPAIPTRRHYDVDPVAILAKEGVDAIINLSASPWHIGKTSMRETLLVEAARQARCPVIYCNMVGGNDELIFDGNSRVVQPDGFISASLDAFKEHCAVVPLGDKKAKPRPSATAGYAVDPAANTPEAKADKHIEDIYHALVLGLRDYAWKCGFAKAVIGLSGGIDSAVTAALAVDALGQDKVTGISLPSSISSEHSRADARELAERLGIQFETLPIQELVDAAETTLTPLFHGHGRDVTEENIQARARGLLLMALSNKTHALLLTTGNKSEVAVGYCTLYGDMAGGLAVLSDVSKMQVYALARYLNRISIRIPQSTLDKPPSAELRPDQRDEDSLPPYPVLDEILRLYVEEGYSGRDIISRGFDASVVRDIIRKVDLNEYKRKQAAPGLKVTPLAFGVGRRIPIVQKYVS